MSLVLTPVALADLVGGTLLRPGRGGLLAGMAAFVYITRMSAVQTNAGAGLEMVVITAGGAEYLSQPQRELYLVKQKP